MYRFQYYLKIILRKWSYDKYLSFWRVIFVNAMHTITMHTKGYHQCVFNSYGPVCTSVNSTYINSDNGLRLSCYLDLWLWWRHQMEAFSALLALCVGNSPVTGEFPPQRTSNLEHWCFFDVGHGKLLSKRSNGRWPGTPWISCDVSLMTTYYQLESWKGTSAKYRIEIQIWFSRK